MSYKSIIVGDRSFRVPDVVYEEFGKLNAECAELRPDALRYRWLRTIDVTSGIRVISFEFPRATWDDIERSDFDSKIDAAMGEKP